MRKTTLGKNNSSNAVPEFVASAHLFSSALTEVLQAGLLRQVGRSDLSFSHLKLLQLLAVAKTQTVSELAMFLGVSKAAGSKMVDRLVLRGFVSRTVGTRDRRSAHVSLTARSHRLLADYEKRRLEKLAKIFRGCATRDLTKMAKLLDQVTAAIVYHSANPGEVCLHCGIYFPDRCLVRDLGGRNCQYRQRAQRRSRTEREHRVQDLSTQPAA